MALGTVAHGRQGTLSVLLLLRGPMLLLLRGPMLLLLRVPMLLLLRGPMLLLFTHARDRRGGRGGRAPDLPSSRSPELQISRAPELQISRAPDLPSSRSPELQISRSPDLPSSRSPDLQISRSPDLAKHNSSIFIFSQNDRLTAADDDTTLLLVSIPHSLRRSEPMKTPAEAQRDAFEHINAARYSVRVMSLGNKQNEEFRKALAEAEQALKHLAKFL